MVIIANFNILILFWHRGTYEMGTVENFENVYIKHGMKRKKAQPIQYYSESGSILACVRKPEFVENSQNFRLWVILKQF